MIRIDKNKFLKQMPTRTVGIVGIVSFGILLFLGVATYTAYDAAQKWENAITEGQSYTVSVDMKNHDFETYMEEKDLLQIIKQEGANHDMLILGAEDDNQAKQGYHVELCGNYNNMIYMINALEEKIPLYHMDILNMEPTKDGKVTIVLAVKRME